jgi:hypothetical protein
MAKIEIIGPTYEKGEPYTSQGTVLKLDGQEIDQVTDITLRFAVNDAVRCDIGVLATEPLHIEAGADVHIHPPAQKIEIPEIARVSKANLQPNDVIVLEYDGHFSQQTAEYITSYVKEIWPGRKVVVLEGGLRMRFLGEDAVDVAAMGTGGT